MLESKDHITAEHCRNVARLAVKLGKACGFKGKALRDLELGALLHDLDKLKIPNELFEKLRNGSPLTKEDYETLAKHDSLQGTLPFEDKMPRIVQDCQKLHHENFDGTGIPNGLKADQIPPHVMVLQVADTYDALTLDLPGRKAQTKDQALYTLKQLAGTLMNPELVDKFIKMMTGCREELP